MPRRLSTATVPGRGAALPAALLVLLAACAGSPREPTLETPARPEEAAPSPAAARSPGREEPAAAQPALRLEPPDPAEIEEAQTAYALHLIATRYEKTFPEATTAAYTALLRRFPNSHLAPKAFEHLVKENVKPVIHEYWKKRYSPWVGRPVERRDWLTYRPPGSGQDAELARFEVAWKGTVDEDVGDTVLARITEAEVTGAHSEGAAPPDPDQAAAEAASLVGQGRYLPKDELSPRVTPPHARFQSCAGEPAAPSVHVLTAPQARRVEGFEVVRDDPRIRVPALDVTVTPVEGEERRWRVEIAPRAETELGQLAGWVRLDLTPEDEILLGVSGLVLPTSWERSGRTRICRGGVLVDPAP